MHSRQQIVQRTLASQVTTFLSRSLLCHYIKAEYTHNDLSQTSSMTFLEFATFMNFVVSTKLHKFSKSASVKKQLVRYFNQSESAARSVRNPRRPSPVNFSATIGSRPRSDGVGGLKIRDYDGIWTSSGIRLTVADRWYVTDTEVS